MRPHGPWLLYTAALCIIVGLAVAVGGFALARACSDPENVTFVGIDYCVTKRVGGEQIDRIVARCTGGPVEATLSGSTDTLCDDPWTLLIDMDRDGERDLYFHHCRGHGYLRFDSATSRLRYIDLGQFDPADAPALEGWWFGELRSGALGCIGTGIGLGLLGLLGVAVARRRR